MASTASRTPSTLSTPSTPRSSRSSRTPLRSAVLVLGSAALAVTPAVQATARQEPGPEGRAAPGRTVSAWLPYWNQEAAYRDALRHRGQLHTVSPFWYEAKSARRIDPHSGAGNRRIVDGLRRAGMKVVPTVHEYLEPGALAAVVTRPDRRATHVKALADLVRGRRYDGLDIDYESIAPTPAAQVPEVRAGYAAFVTRLCRELRALRKQCVVTVSPQARGNGRIWDYRKLGAAADRVRLMGYDLHWSGGRPGPLASPDWYDDALRHATALIPRDKLEMALPGYGWDWPADGKGEARHVTWKEAEALRRKVKAPYRIDPKSRTPHFTYKEGKRQRTVWYQDARGVAAHLPVLRKYGVRHTGLWALGFEDPKMWAALRKG